MRLRLDYASPLPPVASGIADYSVDLLPALAERADVRVLALPGQPVAPAVAARWQPVPLAQAGEGGRLPLYQMGNNPHHEALWDLALARPGVLTLHDLVLHHLLGHRTLGVRDFQGYQRALTADHGWVGEVSSLPRLYGQDSEAQVFSLPAHRSLLLAQRGVLVHNRWAAAKIAEDSPEVRVAVVPMGIPLPPVADAAAGRTFRQRWGLPATAPLLGSFGFQTPIKRTAVVLEALRAPALADVHLVVVGEASPAIDLPGLAARLGVAERVHVLGFVDFEEFEAAVGAVDLAVNLRYPTAGETSASLLRVLAAGRPTLVSDFAQFSELPASVAVRVPLGEGEVESLVAQLGALLADRSRLTAMGEAAREHVRREHAPEAAARAVVEACTAWADLAPPAPRPLPVAPPTSLSWRELAGTLQLEGAALPWRDGERRQLRVRVENAGPARWLPATVGPGGTALEVVVVTEDGARTLPWLPVPRSVEAGERLELALALRRPLGPARLHVALRVLGAPEALTPSLSMAL